MTQRVRPPKFIMRGRLSGWILFVGLTCLWVTGIHAGQPKQPNIVLFVADDQFWMDSGAYGNPDLPTPHIDALASQGMRLTHAFTGTAMCAPSRQQLYTGLYPVRSGAFPNHGQVTEGTRSLVHAFRDLGYRVGLVGKEHFGPETSFPFERPRSQPEPGQKRRVGADLEAAKQFISRDPDQPFFLVVASNSPHTPWTEGDRSLFEEDSIEVPEYLVDTPATRRALVEYYAEITHLDQQLGEIMAALKSSGQEDQTLVIYTSEQGPSLPFAKWTLYDAGIRTAMIVRWPEQIVKGSTSDAMIHYVDMAPTLIEAAGGRMEETDGRSFLPVLLGPAQDHRDYVFGIQTTRGIIYGSDYPIRSVRSRRYKLILNLAAENGFQNLISQAPHDTLLSSWQSVDAKRAQAYLHRPALEFYDLETDPWEKKNLADNPEFADQIATHRTQLQNWMEANGDQGLETEMEALEHMNPKIVERIRIRFGDHALPDRSNRIQGSTASDSKSGARLTPE